MESKRQSELIRLQIEKDNFIDQAFRKWRSLCEQEAAIRDNQSTASGPVLTIVSGGKR